MLGDIAPLKEMVAVAKAAGAMVLVDEAHSHGLLRPQRPRRVRGSRASRTRSISSSAPSPSRSARSAASVVSNHPKFEVLRLVCRPYVFTASLPPSRGRHRRDLDPQADARRQQARPSLGEFSKRLHQRPAAISASPSARPRPQSAIIAVILPDQETARAMWQALLERGPLRQHGPPAGDARRHVPAALLALRRA